MRECDPLTLMHYSASSCPLSSLLPSLSPKYISINPSPLPFPSEPEPSFCLSLTYRQSWFGQYFSAQSQHLSGFWVTSKLFQCSSHCIEVFAILIWKLSQYLPECNYGLRYSKSVGAGSYANWLIQGLLMKLTHSCCFFFFFLLLGFCHQLRLINAECKAFYKSETDVEISRLNNQSIHLIFFSNKSAKHLLFPGSKRLALSSPNMTVRWISLVLNWLAFGLGSLHAENKRFDDITLGIQRLW